MKQVLIFLTSIFTTLSISAQDIKGISIELLEQNSNKYTTKVRLYSDAQNIVPRPYLVSYNGIINDTLDLVSTSELTPHLLLRTYEGESTHAGPGIYNITLSEGYRIEGINNIENSGSTSLFKNYQVVIESGLSINSHPTINGLHSEITHDNGTFFYQPLINYSDSIYVKFIDCAEQEYFLPEDATIDHTTGNVSITPSMSGKYSVCIEIEYWKFGSGFISKTVEEILFDTDAIVGTNEIQDLTLFNIYPNPSSDQLSIDLGVLKAQTISIEIYDNSGRLVAQPYNRTVKQGLNTLKIPIVFLESGIYMISLKSENGIESKKFIKH